MSGQPAVVVNKRGGFFTALVQGLFGFLIVGIVCATVLGAFGFWVFDKKTSEFFSIVTSVAGNAENWREIAPEFLSDALNDRRALAYDEKLDINVRMMPSTGQRGGNVVVAEVANRGDELVSMLSLRVTVEDGDGVPVFEEVIAAATPISMQLDHDVILRGPLRPGSYRKILIHPPLMDEADTTVKYEVTELRLWVPPDERPQANQLPAAPDDAPAADVDAAG